MQIIYIHTTDIDSNSTSANFVVNNTYSLARFHNNIHLFLMNSSNEPAELLIQRKFGFAKPDSLTIHDFHAEETKHFSFYRYTLRKIQTLVDAETIVITRALGILPHLFLSGKHVYNKLFFETHDFFYDLTIRDDLKLNKKLKKSLIQKLFFKRLDGLICLNQSQKSLYKKYLPSQEIVVFPTGLNQHATNQEIKEPYLIYAGSFTDSKGLSNIFHLAQLLNGNHKIWIAGARNENEKSAALKEVENRNLSDKIDILPWMSKSELSKYFSRAKMGLLPVKDTFFNRHLTVPLKLLDYYSYNLPVIATDSALLKEWVTNQKTGILVNWDEPEESVNEIEKVLTDSDRYDNMVENVETKAKQHTWSQRSMNQINYFKSIL